MERFCKYCGVNISDTKLDRITCYSKECKRKHDKYIRKNKNKPNFCIICGSDISHKHSKAKICDNHDCLKKYSTNYYKNKVVKKICRDCGCSFEGSLKQVLCDKCREVDKYKNYLPTYTQEIICENCSCNISYVEKYKSQYIPQLKRGLCVKCEKEFEAIKEHIRFEKNEIKRKKEEEKIIIARIQNELNRKKLSERMKIFNPMFIEGQFSKKEVIKRDRFDIQRETSERMKISNPMFNEEIRNKVTNTFNEKIKNGEIIYKRGSEHHLWLGNRKFNKHCRISLRKYVKEELINADFTCSICGKHGGELHVHHEEPLRDIIDKFLYDYQSDSTKIFHDNDTLLKITDDIIEYHYKLKPTIVVCSDCHDNIDICYHKKN